MSNFGSLALLGAEGPGRYDDAETLNLIAETDRRAVLEVLAALEYVLLLESLLSAPYDRTCDAFREAHPSYEPTWFTRYFDYL